MDKHDTLLLGCRNPGRRSAIGSVLQHSYNLLEAKNSQQLNILLQQNRHCIATVVTDMEILVDVDPDTMKQLPVIVVSEDDSAQQLNKGFAYGAADVIPADYDCDAMVHRIENLVQMHLRHQHLQALVEEQSQALQHSNEKMVDVLSSVIEYRSAESGQHILRIRRFTKILLEEVQRTCPEYQLTDEIVSIISSAAALHDVGKISIPDSILLKPGKLDPEEWEVMKTHSILGCRLLDTLAQVGSPEYLRYAYNICRYHHERWDGTGYPDGLSGEAIPLCAQVVGLADCYDALTSKRVYKDAYTFETAVTMILKGECGAFSPKLLECFKNVAAQYERLARAYADGLQPKTEVFDVTLPEPMAQNEVDTLNVVQGKFQCLLHYINCFVMELSVDQGHFHLQYNPYPELASLAQATNFTQLRRIVLNQIVHPQDRQRAQELIDEGIESFLNAGLRRQSLRFLLQDKNGRPVAYDVTLLRANVNQKKNRSVAVLCRKLTEQTAEASTEKINTDMSYLLADSAFCCRNDRDLTLVDFGAATRKLVGYSREELDGIFGNRMIRLVHPEDRSSLLQTLREQFRKGHDATAEYRVVAKDGSVHWVISKHHLVQGADGVEYLHVLAMDNSEAYSAYNTLNEKLTRYEIILAQTENALFEWDLHSDTITFSDTWQQIFGFEPVLHHVQEYMSQGSFFHPDDSVLIEQRITSLKNGSDYEMLEVRVSTAKGRYMWCRFRGTAIRDELGDLQKISGIVINIDKEKKTSQALQERAERDSLTKLLNKYAGRKYAEEYLERSGQDVHCAMLMIDLDNFKPVNDRYGHLFGDTVLSQVSRVLRKMFRSQDIISRVGGDEFMVLMRGISDADLVENRCRQLLRLFADSFRHLNQEVPLSCSVGIAIAPDHGRSYYELFRRADQAMYQAKAQGKNTFAFYEANSIHTYTQNRKMSEIDSDQEPGLAENSLVQYAFQRLYSTDDEDRAINEILDLVGRKMNVSRVYVFENSEDNRTCSNTYEWCNKGIQPEIEHLQGISYETDIAGYKDMYDDNGIFYCPDIHMLPKNIYDIVAPQNIKSLLHCAIRDRGIFRGYIGFDECVEKRMWTKEQIDALTYLCEMLSVFLLKKRQQEKALQQTEEFRSILDNQNAWIYIIDPETCELKYLNAKTRTLAPEAKPGMTCYQALMGNEARCQGCPCTHILETGTDSARLYNRQFDLQILAEATHVQWGGAQSCLLTCREEKCTEN